MRLVILAIDKLRNKQLKALADDYQTRIRRYARLDARELKPAKGKLSIADAREDESGRLLAALPPSAWVVALDERGKNLTSEAFAKTLGRHRDVGRTVAFVIGGANGHAPSLRERADLVLALSSMTLPHEMARVVALEQIYRAFTIIKGEPYHK